MQEQVDHSGPACSGRLRRFAGACDIWMTDVSTGNGAEFAREHHAPMSLWFYYCHMPLHAGFAHPLIQAPNMKIDSEAIDHRPALRLAGTPSTGNQAMNRAPAR